MFVAVKKRSERLPSAVPLSSTRLEVDLKIESCETRIATTVELRVMYLRWEL